MHQLAAMEAGAHMTEFERSLERIADRAVQRRKVAQVIPPQTSVRRDRWQRIVAAMGSDWHTKASLLEQLNITEGQVSYLFRLHRKRLSKRSKGLGGVGRHTYEWRLK